MEQIARPLYSLISVIGMEIILIPVYDIRNILCYLIMLIICTDIFVMTLLHRSRREIADRTLIMLSFVGVIWIPVKAMLTNFRYRGGLPLDNQLTIILMLRIIHTMVMIFFMSRRLYDPLINYNRKILLKGYIIEQDGRMNILSKDYICFSYDDVEDILLPKNYDGYPIIVCNESYDDIAVINRVFDHDEKKLRESILQPFISWMSSMPKELIKKGKEISYKDSSVIGQGSHLSRIILDRDIEVYNTIPYIYKYARENVDKYGSIDPVCKYLQRAISSINIDMLESYGITAVIIDGILRMRKPSIHVYYGCYKCITGRYVLMKERKYGCRIFRIVGSSLPYVLLGSYKEVKSLNIMDKIPEVYSDIIFI